MKKSFTNRLLGVLAAGMVLFVTLGVSFAESTPTAENPLVIERIIAVVNKDIILLSELQQRYNLLKPQLQQIIDPDERKKRGVLLKKQILDKMIQDRLVDQMAVKKQINISDKLVGLAMVDTRKRFGLNPKQFLQALKQQGYTMTSYRAMVRRELRKRQFLQRALRQKVRVNEEEIRDLYNKLVREVGTSDKEFRIRYIVVQWDDKEKPAVVRQKRAKAAQALREARQKPKSFKALCKKYTEDALKDSDCDLGLAPLADLPDTWAKAVKNLAPGQVYKSLVEEVTKKEKKHKLYVLYVDEVKASGVESYKKSRPKLFAQLRAKAYKTAMKRYLAELRKNALVEVRTKW